MKPEVLDIVERKIGQLEMEAKSLKPKASVLPGYRLKHNSPFR